MKTRVKILFITKNTFLSLDTFSIDRNWTNTRFKLSYFPADQFAFWGSRQAATDFTANLNIKHVACPLLKTIRAALWRFNFSTTIKHKNTLCNIVNWCTWTIVFVECVPQCIDWIREKFVENRLFFTEIFICHSYYLKAPRFL